MSNNNQPNPTLHHFTKSNLIILGISLVAIIVGYLLMSGGRSADAMSFNPEIFSPLRIRIAPIITTLGYFGVLVAILYRGKRRSEDKQDA